MTWGEEAVRPLFVDNPQAVIDGAPLDLDMRPRRQPRKWYQFWRRPPWLIRIERIPADHRIRYQLLSSRRSPQTRNIRTSEMPFSSGLSNRWAFCPGLSQHHPDKHGISRTQIPGGGMRTPGTHDRCLDPIRPYVPVGSRCRQRNHRTGVQQRHQ